jgi:hypothetical protein
MMDRTARRHANLGQVRFVPGIFLQSEMPSELDAECAEHDQPHADSLVIEEPVNEDTP